MKKFLIFLIFLSGLVFPSQAWAESKTVEVESDTFANEAYPDKSYSAVGSVTISNHPINRFGFLKFPLGDIPSEAVIDKVVFRFYVHEQSYSSEAKLNLGPVKDDWDENTLNWDNIPSIYQNEAIEARISLDFEWKEIDITSIYNHWRNGDNKGLFVYPYGYLYGTSEGDFAFSFRAKEAPNFGQPADVPQLVINYHLPPSPSPSPSVSPSPNPLSSPSPKQKPASPKVSTEEAKSSPKETEEPTSAPSVEPEKGTNNLPWIFSLGGVLALSLGGGLLLIAKKKRKKEKPPATLP